MGGGAILDGLPEIAEQIFDLPIGARLAGRCRRPRRPCQQSRVRIGRGLTLYAQRGRTDGGHAGGAGAFARIAGRFASLLREFF